MVKDEMGDEKTATFIVDTNILCELKKLDQLPWNNIAPEAKVVRIVILPKVSEEMDAHKNSAKSRLRKRAIEYGQLARRIEESGVDKVNLEVTDPEVIVEFSPIYSKTDLDSELYELDDNDGRILAEAALFITNCPHATFLSTDSKPLRIAKQTGIKCLRPPVDWQREELPDDRDEEIARLKKHIGPVPILETRIKDEFLISENLHFQSAPNKAMPSELVARIVQELLTDNPKTDESLLRKLYKVYKSVPLGGIAQFNGITERQIQNYSAEYDAYSEEIKKLVASIGGGLKALDFLLPAYFELANTGTAIAEDVLVKLELEGKLQFYSVKSVQSYFEQSMPDAPRAPEPVSLNILNPTQFMASDFGNKKDPFTLYLLHEPEVGDYCKSLEFTIDKLRHGEMVGDEFIICGEKDMNREGLLRIKASCANLPHAVEIHVPIRVGSEASSYCKDYLFRSLVLMRPELAEPTFRAIASHFDD